MNDVPSRKALRFPRPALTLRLLIYGAVLAAVGSLAFGPKPRLPQEPLSSTLDMQDAEFSGTDLGLSVTTLRSNFQSSSSNTSMTFDEDRWLARSIAIYNLDDSLLMERVGFALFEALRDEGRFESIHYLPAGERLPDGASLPDMFVSLDLPQWDETRLPGYGQHAGEIRVSVSDQMQRPRFFMAEEFDPPIVPFHWRSLIGYEARQLGIEVAGSRYAAVSNDIAANIHRQLGQFFDELASKYGRAVELPDSFYPQYIEPPTENLPADLQMEKLVDGSGFMMPTLAVWRSEFIDQPRAIVELMSDRLSAGGWSVRSHDNLEWIYASRGDEILEFFEEEPRVWRTPGGRNFSMSGPSLNRENFAQRLVLVYRRKMPPDDILESVRELRADGSNDEAAAMFRNFY